jgi:hypothetical protein
VITPRDGSKWFELPHAHLWPPRDQHVACTVILWFLIGHQDVVFEYRLHLIRAIVSRVRQSVSRAALFLDNDWCRYQIALQAVVARDTTENIQALISALFHSDGIQLTDDEYVRWATTAIRLDMRDAIMPAISPFCLRVRLSKCIQIVWGQNTASRQRNDAAYGGLMHDIAVLWQRFPPQPQQRILRRLDDIKHLDTVLRRGLGVSSTAFAQTS